MITIGPGPLNITFGSDMPTITLFHLMLMSKIYVVNSYMNKTESAFQSETTSLIL